MKTKLFLAAMALFAIVSCNKEATTSMPEMAEGPTSFLQVDLKATGSMTKAEIGSYEYGLDTENLVKTVTFYFFTETGAKYLVQDQQNFLSGTIEQWTEGTEANVEEISAITLVIKQHQSGELPAKMVAVLNAPAELLTSMTLTELGETLIANQNTNGFVMSNSVYVDGESAVINATEITEDNLFQANIAEGESGYNEPGAVILNPADYEGVVINPVQIYVERVAAKVRVQGDADMDLNLIPVMDEDGTQLVDAGNNAVYAKILGWDVTNNTASSYALKQLSATYETLDFTWNNAAFFRSYWAETEVEPLHNITFANLIGKNLNPGYAYYNENTAAYAVGNGVDVDDANEYTNTDGVGSAANQAPQLLVAAQLVNAEGTPIQLAKWYSDLYTISDLKTAMVNTVAHRIYLVDSEVVNEDGTTSTTYKSITADDVTFYQVAQTTLDKRYEVKIKATADETYYNAVGVAYTETEVNAILGAITPAKMWADGYAYYYKDIAHFGTSYGMVRNHLYDITLTGVTGFGTPVYEDEYVITPEPPQDEVATNLAAQINILSWHLVSQDVQLGN